MDKRLLVLIKEYANKKGLPIFNVNPDNIEVIQRPKSYFSNLIDGITQSKERILLSALYLGTGSKEDEIIGAIGKQMNEYQKLSVNIVLDMNRAQRPEPNGLTSVKFIDRLPSNGKQLRLFVYDEDENWIMKLFKNSPRYNEIFSTYHGKLAIFDNDVIISGANLSEAYFINRRDRYVKFKSSKTLADYYEQFFDKVTFQRPLKEALEDFNRFSKDVILESDSLSLESTFVIPLVQHGCSGIFDKEEFLAYIDSITRDENQSKSYLSSGYFNPSPAIDALKFDSILAASKTANSFNRGGRFLKLIPSCYMSLLENYVSNHQNCQPFLYTKPGWSFHAKGIWIETDEVDINIVGSSNFNMRSHDKDFEFLLAIVTTDKELKSKLRAERQVLWSEAEPKQLDEDSGFFISLLARLVKRYL